MSSGHWIQKAIKHPGAFRKKAKAAGAITPEGKISEKWEDKEMHSKNKKVRQEANLAKTLSKMRKHKRM